MALDRHTLSLAAEYAVASELCRRGIYTQLTLGNLKRTDLLALTESGNVVRVEVKAKQGGNWPGCKGVHGKHNAIVFVDLQNKAVNERPDFYVLNSKDWRNFLMKKKREYEVSHTGKTMSIKNNVPVYDNEITKSGRPYEGTSVSVQSISKFKNAWEKIEEILNNI